jgi:hypothetical protein
VCGLALLPSLVTLLGDCVGVVTVWVGLGLQITESLKRCGIADDMQYILAARFDASDEEVRCLGRRPMFGFGFEPIRFLLVALNELADISFDKLRS